MGAGCDAMWLFPFAMRRQSPQPREKASCQDWEGDSPSHSQAHPAFLGFWVWPWLAASAAADLAITPCLSFFAVVILTKLEGGIFFLSIGKGDWLW
jgi:hypothetical protein